MKWYTAFPLLLITVVVYNVMAWGSTFWGPDGPTTDEALRRILFSLPMASGIRWTVSTSDLLIAFSIFLLFFELLKATTSRQITLVNHSLSLIVFIVCLIEFLLIPQFATSTFFLIVLMTLLDVLAGFIVTVITARKDFDLSSLQSN